MPTIISKLRSCTDHVTLCTAMAAAYGKRFLIVYRTFGIANHIYTEYVQHVIERLEMFSVNYLANLEALCDGSTRYDID